MLLLLLSLARNSNMDTNFLRHHVGDSFFDIISSRLLQDFMDFRSTDSTWSEHSIFARFRNPRCRNVSIFFGLSRSCSYGTHTLTYHQSHHECRFECSGVALLVILGAIRYNAALVTLGAVYIVIEVILTPIYLYPVLKELYTNSWLYIAGPIIYGLLILYPHVVFVYEIKTGVWETPNYSD